MSEESKKEEEKELDEKLIKKSKKVVVGLGIAWAVGYLFKSIIGATRNDY